MQNERILSYLQTGKRLTPLIALRRFGCLRLSGRIYELRALGHQIKSELVRRGGKWVSEYWLSGVHTP